MVGWAARPRRGEQARLERAAARANELLDIAERLHDTAERTEALYDDRVGQHRGSAVAARATRRSEPGDEGGSKWNPERLPTSDATSSLERRDESAESRPSGTLPNQYAPTTSREFLDLLGIADPAALDVRQLWASRSKAELLRVPLGLDDHGLPVELDLKEPAQHGVGPHGLCVGATGSGKSEILRTLVLALITKHSPEQLSVLLVDGMGGATFAPLAAVPHVAGLVSHSAEEVGVLERLHTSLLGEVDRRTQVLRDAGVANIGDYSALRTERMSVGDECSPLPHLLVVVDDFDSLLTARPELIDLFLSIGRVGRSIGIHLLLSSQRVEAGWLQRLDAYLSFKIVMRTFSEAESRMLLGTPDAGHLPPFPGFGYLKVGVSIKRFSAAYVSGPPFGSEPNRALEQQTSLDAPLRRGNSVPSQSELSVAPVAHSAVPLQVSTAPSLLSLIVEQLQGAAPPVPPIWLPLLPRAVSLDSVGGGIRVTADGLRFDRLRVPVGLQDDPQRHRQGPWELDLNRAGGNLLILGAPQSGKTTLLRTLVLGLALEHTPAEVAVYVIDLGNGGFGPLAGLPHVGSIATRFDRDRVRRIIEELRAMLELREQVFRDHNLGSLAAMREAVAEGRLPQLAAADVILAIDGYTDFAAEYEDLEHLSHALLTRGGAYGIHVVATATRLREVRSPHQQSFGVPVELRLSDPTESILDRRLAATMRTDTPGRALTNRALLAQVALPRIDGIADPASVADALEQAVRAIDAATPGERAPAVHVLPSWLPAGWLPTPTGEPHMLPIGIDEETLAPSLLDLGGRDEHLLVLGDDGSGKTNLLRIIVAGLIARSTPEELSFVIVDPRRSLENSIPSEYLGGYAASEPLAAQLAAEVAATLAERMAQVAGQARASEPPLPRIVLLVDDYQVLTAAGRAPLRPLLPYLAVARDVGLHVVLTRQVSGAARGLIEPFVRTLLEVGATGLVMSGDRSEGVLMGGVRATRLPPGRCLLVRGGESVRTAQTAYADETLLAKSVAQRPRRLRLVPRLGGHEPAARAVGE